MSRLLREGDVCTRYGGEEFVVVLPATPLAVAREVAERLLCGVADTPMLAAPLLQITTSIGVAEYAAGQTVQALLAAADSAVYAAKHSGRNQVRCAPAPPTQGPGNSSQISLRRRNQGVKGAL